MDNRHGILYICSTPIGNLKDVTLRLLEVLKEADVIVAEDTRHTLKLLNHFNIKKPLLSCHEHNEQARVDHIMGLLEEGKRVALVSDAGTPGISDPGAQVIAAAIDHSLPITHIPGPSAVITALVLSGLDTRRFAFEGFLPRDKGERVQRLAELKEERRTMVFYEAPHRILPVLKDMLTVFSGRRAALARELTKLHEEVVRATLDEIYEGFRDKGVPRGEMVLMVEGFKGSATKEEWWQDLSIKEHVEAYTRQGQRTMDAIKRTARDRGLAKGDVYRVIHGG
jgi:16S rRNA (cytidine1402-2'-O)-methyltransferase